ncbi:hypothetical protein D3C79_842180 [compost metagenome]
MQALFLTSFFELGVDVSRPEIEYTMFKKTMQAFFAFNFVATLSAIISSYIKVISRKVERHPVCNDSDTQEWYE